MNSIQLDGEHVKMIREMRGVSQESLAESAGASARTIQRIERNDSSRKAKQDTAESIAQVLGVALNTLLASPDRGIYSWLIMREGEPIKLSHDLSSLIEEVIAFTMPFREMKRDDVTLHIQSKELPWSVTVEHHFESGLSNNEMTWSFRPVCYDEECGMLWTKPTLYEEFWWKTIVAHLCYNTAYDVLINGDFLVPNDAKCKYLALFYKRIGQHEKVIEGYQLFNDEAGLAISLGVWLSERQTRVSAHQEHSTGKLSLATNTRDLYQLDICRVWSKGDGVFERAPWTYMHKEELENSINERKVCQMGPVSMVYSEPLAYKQPITPMIPAILGSPVIHARFGLEEGEVDV